ncbi:hypothetical protein Bbelb_366160 [Branchiostoma belcheri]|nr:hypothetical protein Bbelb_366160 [Branchiostoma belcheri]
MDGEVEGRRHKAAEHRNPCRFRHIVIKAARLARWKVPTRYEMVTGYKLRVRGPGYGPGPVQTGVRITGGFFVPLLYNLQLVGAARADSAGYYRASESGTCLPVQGAKFGNVGVVLWQMKYFCHPPSMALLNCHVGKSQGRLEIERASV